MIMPREKRVIQKDDIIPLDIYTKKKIEKIIKFIS